MSKSSGSGKNLMQNSYFRVGEFLVQPDRLILIKDDHEIKLAKRQMDLLVFLAKNAKQTMRKEDLLYHVWGSEDRYDDNPVQQAISRLRDDLDDDARNPRYIKVFPKRGYALIAKVIFPDDYLDTQTNSDAWITGNPYVGLGAYDSKHEEVFFGRGQMVVDLLIAMRAQIDSARRFVLMIGASGCGKTSLLHAGAMPKLRLPGGFSGLATMAEAHCDLALTQGDDVLTLMTSALQSWAPGKRPVFAPMPTADLAKQFVERPAVVTEAIAEALRPDRVRAWANQSHAHLLLTIDHAEKLVSHTIASEERAAFANLLRQLCESPGVLVVMIARSDFYHRLNEDIPEIAEREAGEGHLFVRAPSDGEITEMIRGPARAANLRFEQDASTSRRLDDVLRDAAAAHPDALPLLQHTLHALYEQHEGDGELRFDFYRKIGGLEGAIAHQAETVYSSLPTAAQDRLGDVLTQLVVMQPENDAISARRVPTASFPDDGAKSLIESFIAARLFVSGDHNRRPHFGVVHEALLRQWPRARDWAHNNRRLLHAREQLKRATARWIDATRSDDHLLNPGRPLSDALEAAQRFNDLDADERELLNASQRKSRRRKILRYGAVVALAVLTVVSTTMALVAIHARNVAQQRKEDAQDSVGYMLDELAKKLNKDGNLELLEDTANNVISKFEKRPISDLDAKDLTHYARAYRILGAVRNKKTDFDRSNEFLMTADRLAKLALSRAPDMPDALKEQGQIAFWFGQNAYDQKHWDDAERYWRIYVESSERLNGIDPRNLEWQTEMSYVTNILGTIAFEKRKFDDALAMFRRSERLKKRIYDSNKDGELFKDLIDTQSWISRTQEAMGDLNAAARGYQTEIEAMRELLDGKENAKDWEFTLTNIQQFSAKLAIARGDPAAAEAELADCIPRLSELVKAEDDNFRWRRTLATAYFEAARAARLLGKNADSLTHLQNAQDHLRIIFEKGQVTPAVIRLDASIRVALAQYAASPENLRLAAHASSDLHELSGKNPDDIHIAIALANTLIDQGLMEFTAGNPESARAHWKEAVDSIRKFASGTKDHSILAPWVKAHRLLGETSAVTAEVEWLKTIGYRDRPLPQEP